MDLAAAQPDPVIEESSEELRAWERVLSELPDDEPPVSPAAGTNSGPGTTSWD